MGGRLGAASVLVGAAIHIAECSVDGYALPTLAETWALAPSSQRADLEFGARLALVAIGGPSTVAPIILWGSVLILYGLAVKVEVWVNGYGLCYRGRVRRRGLRDLTSVTSASIHSTPWKRATLTRWWPSLTKYFPPSPSRLTGGNSCPRRKALSIRFHFSAEALGKGMKFWSNCSCLPTLPTILDTSTVLLPRYILPLAGTLHRSSSGERRVFLVPRLSKRVFNLPSRARLRATVKSRSSWSSRFIRSTTIITFLVSWV